MFGTRVVTSLVAFAATVVVLFTYSSPILAQTADQDAKMKVLQQRIDDMSKQLKQLQDEQAKTTKTVSTVDKAWNTFIKGFFGTLDVSIDETTKGMNGMVAYGYACSGANGHCATGRRRICISVRRTSPAVSRFSPPRPSGRARR